jgi:peptidoglycan/xylan/chitin deacetylase (PgdA/CDA1 family)
MKPGVYITIDVECSMGGAFEDAARRPVSPERAMMGDYGGRPMGVPLITDLLRASGLAGTFFFEPFAEEQGYPGAAEPVARFLAEHGQDVQLHIHPCYKFYDLHRRGLPYPRTDDFSDLEAADATALLREGAGRIEAWTGRPVVAFRAGNMAASEATLPVLAAAGIRIDSSYTFPFAGGQCRFSPADPYNGSKPYGDVLEVALSGLRRPRLPGVHRAKPLDLVGISFEECREAIRRISAAGADSVLILHSFSLVKVRNLAYDGGRLNRIVTRRLRRLCEWLGRNADEYPVRTFSQLAEAVAAGTYEPHAAPPPTVFGPRAIVRKAVQLYNRVYWT